MIGAHMRRNGVALAIDAGGSGTRVIAEECDGHSSEFAWPTLNAASGSEATADQRLGELLEQLAQSLEAPFSGSCWFASAGVDDSNIGRLYRTLAQAFQNLGDISLIVTGDVTPLLWASELAGEGIVVVAGTGSSVIGRHRGVVAKAGGYEYVVSDEGGGVDIGRRAVREALRAFDGRGPTTTLLPAVERHFGLHIGEVGRYLANMPSPKVALASLAPLVLAAMRDCDPVASTVVTTAARDLALSVKTVANKIACTDAIKVGLAGSLLTHSDAYFQLVRDGITLEKAETLKLVTAPVRVILSLIKAELDPGLVEPLPIKHGVVKYGREQYD